MSGATTGRASLPKRCGAAAALAYKICSGSLLLLLLLQALDGTGATAAATATTTSACDAAANRLSDACDIFQNAKSKILLEPEEDCWVPCKRTSGPSWTAHEIVRVRDRSDLVGDWRLIGEYGEVKRAPSKKSRTIEVAFPQFGDKIIRVAKQALSATSKKTKNAINAPAGTTGASGANKENKQIFPTRIHIEAKDVRYFKTANPMGSEAARKRGKSAGLPNPKSKTKATRKHVGGKAKAAAKAVVRPSTNVAAGGGAAVVAETRPSKPSTATVTYVAEAWSSEVVTFHGISFGQADLFKPPTDPRDDQLGYAEKIFAPGSTAAPSRTLRRAVSTSDSVDDVDVEKVKLKELDAVDAGDGTDPTTTGSTGIMSTTSEASLSSKNRRTHKQREGGVFKTGVEAPTPKVGGAPPTVLDTSVSGPPAPAEPKKKVEKFRFFAMDRRSACQDGTIHMRQEQASSRNCLRLDITLPTKHAIAYSSLVKEQQFEEMFQDSSPKPKSKGKANANANYAAASGGTRGQKRPREHDVSAAASTGVEKQKAESGSALGAGKVEDDVLEQDGTAAHHALADEDHNPPNKPKPALLPVFVYFTGSCFAAGAQTDGTQLIKNMMAVDPRGAIFVSLQFRAGTLGHAGSEGLKAIQQTQKHEQPAFANWSLLDSRLALRWIQRHIGAFGGDRTRVTLFGQSSGACMASAHFLSPKSFDLFSSLITSSGGFNGWCTAPLDSVGEDQFEQLYLKAVQHKRQKPKCFEPDVLRGSSPALAAPPAAKKSAVAAASTNKAKAKPLTAKAKAKAKAAGAASKARGGLSFLQGTRFQHAKAKARPRAPTTSKDQERNKRICMARFLTQSKLSEYDLASFSVPSPCFSGCDSSLLVDQQELRGTMPEILTFGIPGVHFAEHKPVLHGYTGDDGVEYMGEIGKKKENISDNPKWIRDENGFLTYLDWAFGDATSAKGGEKESAPNLSMDFYKKLAIAYEPKDVREPRVIDVEKEGTGAKVGVDLDGVVIDLELEQPPYPLPQVVDPMMRPGLLKIEASSLKNAVEAGAPRPPGEDEERHPSQKQQPPPSPIQRMVRGIFTPLFSNTTTCPNCYVHPGGDQHIKAFNYLYKPKSGAKALLPAIYEPPTGFASAQLPAPVLNVKVNHPEETQTGFVDQQQMMNSIVLGLSATNAEILGVSERLSAAQNTWNTFAPWFFAAERALTGWEYTCQTEYASDLLAKKSVKVFEYAYMDSNNYIKDDANTPLVPHGWESGPLFDEIEEDATQGGGEGDGDSTPAEQMKQQPEPPQVSPHLPTDFGFLMERCELQRDLQQEHAKLKTLADELKLYNAAAIAKIRERIGIIERFLPEGESSGGASSDFSCGLAVFGTSSMTGLAMSSGSGAGAFGGFGSSGLFGGGSARAAPAPLISSATARAQPRPLSVMVTPRAAAPAFGQEYDKSRGFSDMSTTIGGLSTRTGFSAAPESSSSSFSSSWAGSRAMLASRNSTAPQLITVDESSRQHRAAETEEPQGNIFKASLPHWPQFTSDRRVAFSLARGQFFGLNNRLDTSEQCGLWKSEWSQAFTCIPHELEKPWPTRTS
eukprot:g5801.t1